MSKQCWTGNGPWVSEMIASLIIAATLSLAPPDGYSARCLIEVAALSNESDLAMTPDGRASLREKADVLDRLTDNALLANDELWRAGDAWEAEQRDLFENGLITTAEWSEVQRQVGGSRETIRDQLASLSAPSCGFVDSHRFLPVFSKVEAWSREHPSQ